ncbi:MAG: phosphate acetyltransferase [Candidatus Peregrinibacteria bacterium]
MHSFIKTIRRRARNSHKRIVFTEGLDERVLRATEKIMKKKIADIILLGPPRKIKEKAKKLKLKIDWKKIKIIDPLTSKLSVPYAKTLFELREEKGLTLAQSKKLLKDENYFGTMMVYTNSADGMITGAAHETADSIRPALQIIKTKEAFHKASGIYFMVLEKRLLLFADTAITIDPNSHDLADIAMDTAQTAKKFGITPKIALLSFSTKSSVKNTSADKIREAVGLIKNKMPDLTVDGELQVDAALVPEVAKRKCPDSPIKGDANILIFPNLESANIGYKLVERLARATAIGPFLQGLKKPINDLSRGCNYKDIVNAAAFTACECEVD